MSKPDWKNAPGWATYLAQDFDGDWVWWEELPRPVKSIRNGFWSGPSKQRTAVLGEKANDSWKSTLESRP